MGEWLVYWIVRVYGAFIRLLPLPVALFCGRLLGYGGYFFNVRHRRQAYANLRTAFGPTKSPREIRRITRQVFINFGQNLIDILRLPLLTPEKFNAYVDVEGKDQIEKALQKGKGAILLAMHFGSWELASLSCAMWNLPYKVFVRPQTRFSRLHELLNQYRECGGSVVLTRGAQTRDFIKSLKDNQIVGMVVDQGGRDGMLVPFFNRQASMSVGAIRMGLKMDVPILFSVIVRQPRGRHKITIHPPLLCENTGNPEKDIYDNLEKIVRLMETYITQNPEEYVWFYKIWKYSKETKIVLLTDGKTGHLRQSEALAEATRDALAERDIVAHTETVEVVFKSRFAARLFIAINLVFGPFFNQGHLHFIRFFLKKDSYAHLTQVKPDFIISTGSSLAAVNQFLAGDHQAKSMAVLKPGILPFRRFDLIVLPQHDVRRRLDAKAGFAVTRGAPNMISEAYLKTEEEKLLSRFSHLKNHHRTKIGVFLGGDSKEVYISEQQVRILARQLKEVAKNLHAELLITTSRRTPNHIEQFLFKEFKKDAVCPLLILANQENIPEAVGGILALSEIVVVSGDSISMVSEAASSGKKVVVFSPKGREIFIGGSQKHKRVIERLNEQGYILSSRVKDIGQSIFDLAKNKIQTRRLDDREIMLEAVRRVI